MYVFVTYGRKRMRGVQVRGIRIAMNLPREKVLFLNSGEGSWLKKFGFKVENVNLDQFFPPKKNLLPKDTSCLIFSDLPSNRPGQTALLIEAMRKKIPVVVIDNIYSARQLRESAFANTLKVVDSLILLGLSFLKDKVKKKDIVVIPPLIEKPTISTKEARKLVFKKYQLKGEKKLILSMSYNKLVLEIVKKTADKFPNVAFILLGGKIKEKIRNVRTVPVVGPEEIVRLIMASDLVLCKMGYQQVLEALALGRPVITLGEEKGFRKYWLDNALQEVMFHFRHYSSPLVSLVEKILFKEKFRGKLLVKIDKLHDGSFEAIKTIIKVIQTIKFKPKKLKRVLFLTIERRNLKKIKKIIKKRPFILPIIISLPFFTKTGVLARKSSRRISDFETYQDSDIIHADFSLLANFSPHSTHGLVKIFPWYEDLLNFLNKLVLTSDKVIVLGEKTYLYFADLLREVPEQRLQIKV